MIGDWKEGARGIENRDRDLGEGWGGCGVYEMGWEGDGALGSETDGDGRGLGN